MFISQVTGRVMGLWGATQGGLRENRRATRIDINSRFYISCHVEYHIEGKDYFHLLSSNEGNALCSDVQLL